MLGELGDVPPQPELFRLASNVYEALETAPSLAWLELNFKLKLADSLGYKPELGQCMQCGTASGQRDYFFIPALGGIIDSSCKTGLESAGLHGCLPGSDFLFDRFEN